MPPRVITLIEIDWPVSAPNSLNTMAVTTRDSGIAVSVMKVVRRFIKNRNRTTTTKIPPINRASST